METESQNDSIENKSEHAALNPFCVQTVDKKFDESVEAQHPSSCESENWIQMRDPQDNALEQAECLESVGLKIQACQIICIRPNNETKKCMVDFAAEPSQSACESDESQWISMATKVGRGEKLEVPIIRQLKKDERVLETHGIVPAPPQESNEMENRIEDEFEAQKHEENLQTERHGNYLQCNSSLNQNDDAAENFEDGIMASSSDMSAEEQSELNSEKDEKCWSLLNQSGGDGRKMETVISGQIAFDTENEMIALDVSQARMQQIVTVGMPSHNTAAEGPVVGVGDEIALDAKETGNQETSIQVQQTAEQFHILAAQQKHEVMMKGSTLLQELLIGKVRLAQLSVADCDAVTMALGQQPLAKKKWSKQDKMDNITKLLGEFGGNCVSSVPVPIILQTPALRAIASNVVIPSAMELVHCKYGTKSIAKVLADSIARSPEQPDGFCARFEIMHMLALTLGSFHKPSTLTRNLNDLSVDLRVNCAKLHKKMDYFASLIDKSMGENSSCLETANAFSPKKKKHESQMTPHEPNVDIALQHTSKKPRKERKDKGVGRKGDVNADDATETPASI